MTVIVGFLPGKGGRAALDLGAQIARSAGEKLLSVTVVPTPWPTPSMARVDGEFERWAVSEGQKAIDASYEYLTSTVSDVEHESISVSGKSVSAALVRTAERQEADILVLGSSSDGPLGQIVVGSTADRLLHSSPVPLALAPRGYHPPKGAVVTRVTCSFAGYEGSAAVLRLTARITGRVGACLRVATFGVRGRTMYPPEVGLHAEDEVLSAWQQQAKAAQDTEVAALAAAGLLPEGTTTAVASGRGWSEALDDLHWEAGDVLVVGSSSAGPLARVFLGSRATKIIRHSPVPAIVVPYAVAEG
ncbi:universal stress protein [Nakamurella silvestris]|nr:universal stress protein [Nakamurella silvestris]